MKMPDMRLLLALALALAPAAARAVTLTVNGTHADVLIGANACKSKSLLAAWDLQQTPIGADTVKLIGTSDSSLCTSTTAPAAPNVTFFNSSPTAQQQTFTVTASQMVLSNADGGVAPCDDPDIVNRTSANPRSNVLCVQHQIPSGLGQGPVIASDQVNVRFALAPPLPPRALAVTPGDAHLKVTWSKGDDAENIANYDVHVLPLGVTSDAGPAAHVTSTNADVSRTDLGTPLTNDAGYNVYVIANDSYANVSGPSNPAIGFPVAVSDFYNHYRDAGGDAQGCSTSGSSFWIAGVALGAALLLRKRRKARDGAALVALFALLAPAARAEPQHRPNVLVAFKIDRYDPKVDSEPGLTGTPYHDIFGPKAPLRYQLEVDWEVAHPFGSLLIGGTFGFWQNRGKGILKDSPPDNPKPSEDNTLLNVFPVGLIATYRFDYLVEMWQRFPFIPYAQVGLMRAFWITYNGRGDVSKDIQRGGNGSGWTNGYTTALGVAFNLGAIDPGLAREAYLDTGIQRSSFFAEYGWTKLSGFNKPGHLILSDHAWRFGVSVEF